MRCPFTEYCKCPGGENFKPKLGLVRDREYIFCLDHNIKIPVDQIRQKREGRHTADALAAAEKIAEARRRWAKSEKGKEARRRYLNSEKGREAVRRYSKTISFKLSLKKYYANEKGKKARERAAEKRKHFRKACRWLQENPGKTYLDYLKETSGNTTQGTQMQPGEDG